MGRADAEIAFMAVLQTQQLGTEVAPASGLLPQLGGLDGGHQDLLGAGRVHLLANDGFDLSQHAHAERQPRVETGREQADQARPEHQPVADDLGLRRRFPASSREACACIALARLPGTVTERNSCRRLRGTRTANHRSTPRFPPLAAIVVAACPRHHHPTRRRRSRTACNPGSRVLGHGARRNDRRHRAGAAPRHLANAETAGHEQFVVDLCATAPEKDRITVQS